MKRKSTGIAILLFLFITTLATSIATASDPPDVNATELMLNPGLSDYDKFNASQQETTDPFTRSIPVATMLGGIFAFPIILRSQQKKDKRNEKFDEAEKLLKKAEDDNNRDLNADEQKRYNELMSEIRQLDEDIKAEETAEKMRAQKAEEESRSSDPNKRENGKKHGPDGRSNDEKRSADLKKYSIAKIAQAQLGLRKLDGIEKEMDDEARKEARERGFGVEGTGIPSFLIEWQGREKREAELRALDVSTEGTDAVPTELYELIPALRPRLMVQQLGARMLTGLTSDIDIPRHNGVAAAVWEGEGDANAATTPTLNKLSLSPQRLGAYTDVSKKLIMQSPIAIEQFVREDLEMAIKIALDAAAIEGSGSAPIPRGVLNTSGIGAVAGGTNGATPDWADIVDLETAVAIDNALMENLAYLTTPGIKGYLKQTLLDSGSGKFIWPQELMTLNGYRAEVSTQVPNDLTKGTASGICHAIIFGNWRELILAQWGGADLVVDPYTRAIYNEIRMVLNTHWDVGVRHAESFAAMQDALTS